MFYRSILAVTPSKGYLKGDCNTNWAGVEEGGSGKTQPQPILDPSDSIIRLAISACSITYQIKAPASAEGEEKARYPQERECDFVYCSVFANHRWASTIN